MRDPLLFATSNHHKLEEVRRLLPSHYKVISLRDIEWNEDIPEPYDSFEANAAAKTNFLFERTGLKCFAEDSGLVIDALDGNPGVLSARYSGGHDNTNANVQKVLTEMQEIQNRTARFISVFAYQTDRDTVNHFTGKVEGDIATLVSGSGGFGYDPIFIPKGFSKTFGELPSSIKDSISHRAKSLQRLLTFLSNT